MGCGSSTVIPEKARKETDDGEEQILKQPHERGVVLSGRRQRMTINYDTQGIVTHSRTHSNVVVAHFDEIKKRNDHDHERLKNLAFAWQTVNMMEFVSAWSCDLIVRYPDTTIWMRDEWKMNISQLYQWIATGIICQQLEDIEERTEDFLGRTKIAEITTLKQQLLHIEDSFLAILQQSLCERYVESLWKWWMRLMFDCLERMTQRRTLRLT